jgi:hypothetical protein
MIVVIEGETIKSSILIVFLPPDSPSLTILMLMKGKVNLAKERKDDQADKAS